jgi:hypothetical protein
VIVVLGAYMMNLQSRVRRYIYYQVYYRRTNIQRNLFGISYIHINVQDVQVNLRCILAIYLYLAGWSKKGGHSKFHEDHRSVVKFDVSLIVEGISFSNGVISCKKINIANFGTRCGSYCFF